MTKKSEESMGSQAFEDIKKICTKIGWGMLIPKVSIEGGIDGLIIGTEDFIEQMQGAKVKVQKPKKKKKPKK